MGTRSIVLGFIAVLALATPALAQTFPPLDPPVGNGPEGGFFNIGDCTVVQGTAEITSLTDTDVEGTLAGDLEGSFAETFTATEEVELGPIVITFSEFEGSVTATAGGLTTVGLFVTVDFMMFDIVFNRANITGGDGDYEGASGVIYTFGTFNDMMQDLGYVGFICLPPDGGGGDD